MIIYKITNLINNKIYIGKTTKSIANRFRSHLKNAKNKINRYLYDAMNKYGYENFTIEEIETVKDAIGNDREIYWIAFYKSNEKEFGYNMTIGGDGGNTGKYHSCGPYYFWVQKHGKKKADEIRKIQYQRAGESARTRKRIVSKETREKISKHHKENGIKPPILRGSKHPRYGKKFKHSQETKSKMSSTRSGKTYEELFGKEKSDEIKHKKKISFSGSNNPKFVNFSIDQKITALRILEKEKIPMSSLCKRVQISEYKFRQWIRTFDVINYQKLYNGLNLKEWKSFWRNIDVDKIV